jgi:hypothetical protein
MLALFHAVLDEDENENGGGIPAEQAMNDGIYRMGFIRLTQNARARLEAPLDALVREGMLRVEDGALRLGWEAFLREPEGAGRRTADSSRQIGTRQVGSERPADPQLESG